MTPFAAATGVQAAAALAAALAAVLVLVLPDRRPRRAAMAAALVLTALTVLAVAEEQARDLVSGRLGIVVAGAAAALGALLVLAAAFRRWPGLFAVAAVIALPARIPVGVGEETANLLVPLYGVIAAGALAALTGGMRGQDRPGASSGGRAPGQLVLGALAVVVALYAVQAVYSTDVEAAAKDVGCFYVPFAVLARLLLDLSWTPRLVRALLVTVVALGCLFAAVGLYQFATRELILDNEKVLLANELKPYFRVNSLFYDPNIYGRFLALAMVLLAGVVLWARTRRVVLACAPLLALLWAGLVPSLSESSFAALAVGLGVLAGLRWSWPPVLAAGAAVAVLAVAVMLVAPSAVGLETQTFEAFDRSTSGRAELIRGGLEMAADRPVGGFGSGSFAERYRDREGLLSPRSPAESHTIPVTVLAEQGAVGLAAYLALLLAACAAVLRGARRPARAAVAAAFVALVAHTLVYAAFLEDPITWTLLAAAIALRRGEPEDPAPAGEAHAHPAAAAG